MTANADITIQQVETHRSSPLAEDGAVALRASSPRATIAATPITGARQRAHRRGHEGDGIEEEPRCLPVPEAQVARHGRQPSGDGATAYGGGVREMPNVIEAHGLHRI